MMYTLISPHMADTTRFGEWLKAARERRGLSGSALAIKTGRSRATLSRLENGERNPSRGIAEEIALALGVDPDAALRAAGFIPSGETVRERPLHYVTDPDTARLVELYEGTPPAGKQMILSAAELANDLSREGAIGGKRASDDNDNPAEPE